MKDEPGIDLSNPAPGDSFDDYKESIMEMLETKAWLDLKVTATAGPTMPVLTYGSPIMVDVIPTGPGSRTFTITVAL